jgi:hypothetical protein
MQGVFGDLCPQGKQRPGSTWTARAVPAAYWGLTAAEARDCAGPKRFAFKIHYIIRFMQLVQEYSSVIELGEKGDTALDPIVFTLQSWQAHGQNLHEIQRMHAG